MGQEAERAEPVVDRDDDRRRPRRAWSRRSCGRRPGRSRRRGSRPAPAGRCIAAAQRRRVDVEIQAVLADRPGRQRTGSRRACGQLGPNVRGVPDAPASAACCRRPPPQVRRSAERRTAARGTSGHPGAAGAADQCRRATFTIGSPDLPEEDAAAALVGTEASDSCRGTMTADTAKIAATPCCAAARWDVSMAHRSFGPVTGTVSGLIPESRLADWFEPVLTRSLLVDHCAGTLRPRPVLGQHACIRLRPVIDAAAPSPTSTPHGGEYAVPVISFGPIQAPGRQ